MAGCLSPEQAVRAASSAYTVRKAGRMSMPAAEADIGDMFDVLHGQRFVGESGFVGIKKASGFGYVAQGVGVRRNECLVSVRGTVTTYDWVTDARMGAVSGPHGQPVHAGFWDAARSVLPQINASLQSARPSALHVVGHSLGGAIASLIADALSDRYAVKLYTFAAPRSGLPPQVIGETGRLGSENIFRVYHDNDVVPMVPLWPYHHLPFGSEAYRLRGPGAVLSFGAHRMQTYIDSVQGQSWAELGRSVVHGLRPFEDARDWLKGTAQSSGSSFLMGATWVLDKLLWALEKIIQSALKVTGHTLGTGLLAGATVLDFLARLLHSGVLASIDIAEHLGYWMRIAMQWMGIAAGRGMNLSAALIAYVLGRLRGVIDPMVRRALDLLI